MFKKIFAKSDGIRVRVMDTTYEFSDLDEFEHFLAAKTEIPADKMSGLLKFTDKDLENEIKQITMVEKMISSKLAESINDPGTIDRYLGEATLTRFTQDHDWRPIIFDLSNKDEEYTEYKTAAVTNYLKYLRSRRSVMASILENRGHSPNLGETVAIANLDHEHESSKTVFARTAVVDVPSGEHKQIVSGSLARLDKGITTDVDAGELAEIPIRMASRLFTLRFSKPLVLVDASNREHALQTGENLVGRDLNCHVRLDNEYPDISRRHVIIQPLGDGKIRVTDLSSQGTFLPAELL